MLVTRELSAGHAQDVDYALLTELDPQRYPVYLHSAGDPGPHARWDILFISDGNALELTADADLLQNQQSVSGDFLDVFDSWYAQERASTPARSTAHDAFPFIGGWCLYLAYEFAAMIEPSVPHARPDDGLPLALALRCPAAVVIDRALRRAWLISETGSEQIRQRLSGDLERLRQAATSADPLPLVASEVTEDAPQRYLEAVDRIREYILAGDVFQVNLSREWRAEFDEPVSAQRMASQLNRSNPSPFAGMLHWQGVSLLSSSPERLVSVAGAVVQTRPIAGTRPRIDRDLDQKRREELISHPKERAEHIMLLDLERNDLGRICRPGTVQVDEFMGLESYAHVHHIVSNVSGRLKPGTTPGQVLRAVFPGGTITGCPKVRCMQIIHELEGAPRGAYTGALGYIDHRGRMDMNILIRSLVLNGSTARLRTGAGIVADSDPRHELQETRAKARGLLAALQGGAHG